MLFISLMVNIQMPCVRLFDRRYNGEAPLDWMLTAYHHFKSWKSGGAGEDYVSSFEKERRPTHGQVMDAVWNVKLESQSFQSRIPRPHAAFDFPVVVIAGSHDFVSAISPIERFAGKLNAVFKDKKSQSFRAITRGVRIYVYTYA